jgi:hypothetical protein
MVQVGHMVVPMAHCLVAMGVRVSPPVAIGMYVVMVAIVVDMFVVMHEHLVMMLVVVA